MSDPTRYLPAYRDGLLEDCLPFWMRHGLDAEHGGVLTSLDRDGSLIDGDKAIWAQGRFAWLLATLYTTVEPREEWLAGAISCLGFLERHGFDEDGGMRFLVTRDGRPLRTRRYAYSEAFGAMAFGACAKATGDQRYAERARELFASYQCASFEPGGSAPKVDPATRPSKGLGPLMIGINVAQTLRSTIDLEGATACIDEYIEQVRRDFAKPELGALLETVAPDGRLIDSFDGRLLNPGHGIEAAWFLLNEARLRGGDPELQALGLELLEWMWTWGWDAEYGGILYFRDVLGKPVQEYWHDMKFWWPHNEAIIATLLAWHLTGEARWAERHAAVHDWAHRHFADPEHGEWFGYLHRDGSRSSDQKGGHWKGPFHLPRMQWFAWQLLEERARAEA